MENSVTERIVTTENLPKGKLRYNNPLEQKPSDVVQENIKAATQTSAPLQGTVTTEELPAGRLQNNNPLDNEVLVPQEVVKANTADLELQSKDTTIGSYIGNRLSTMFDNLSTDLEESQQRAIANARNAARGDVTKGEAILSTVGASANFLADAVGEVVVNIAGSAADGVSYAIPDDVEDVVKGGFKAAWDTVLNSSAGQAGLGALTEGIDAWDDWAESNPRAAENIKSVVDIGLLVTPVKGGASAKQGTIRKKIGDSLEEKGNEIYKSGSLDANEKSKFKHLDSFSNTKDKTYLGRTRSERPVIKKNEQLAIEETQQIPKYNPNAANAKQINENFNKVDKVLNKAKDVRDRVVESSSVELSKNSVIDKITKNLDEAREKSIDVEEFDGKAGRLLDITEGSIAKHGKTPGGLDAVRRDINQFMEDNVPVSQRSDMSNPIVRAAAAARSAIKESIEEVLPPYKIAQDKVSGLMTAKAGLEKKLAEDAGSAILNMLDSGLRSVGLSRDFAFMLSAVGIGTYAQLSLPIIVGGGASILAFKGAKGIYKGISKSNGKKAIGSVLKISGEAIKNAKGNPSLIKQIRADRAAMLEMIRLGMSNYKGEEAEDTVVEDLEEDQPQQQLQRDPETGNMVIPITQGN